VKTETTPPYRQRRSLARSKAQIAMARELRRNQTESEEIAWRLLRTLRFKGFKFRRQYAVGRYIVDFCCPQRRLIVELDGSVHAQPSQAKRDARRDTELKRMGYTVTRLPNGMIMEAPELFVGKVLDVAWSLPNAFTGEL
jgi:very-short-patch-repair endonuclease